MRFGQQKFLIVALLCSMPLLGLFSLIESPYLSQSLLKFSLRFANFRTGLKITAKGWDLHPTKLSASLYGVSIVYEDVLVKTNRLEVQVSPIELALGEAHLRSAIVYDADIRGVLPDRFFEAKKETEDSKTDIAKLPDLAADALKEVNGRLLARNISFSELSVRNADIKLKRAQVKGLNLSIINQVRGQARVALSFDSFGLPGKISQTPALDSAFSLTNTGKGYAILLRKFSVSDFKNSEISAVKLSGKFPGALLLNTDLDLSELNNFFKNSPDLSSYIQPNLKGKLKSSVNINVNSNESWSMNLDKVEVFNLSYDVHHLKKMFLSASYNTNEKVDVKTLELVLPHSITDAPDWEQKISLSEINLEKNKVSGRMNFEETGLCSILYASGVDECFASFPLSGVANFEGDLDPLRLNVTTEWQMGAGIVYSEAGSFKQKAKSILLKTNPAKFASDLSVFPRDMKINKGEIFWGDTGLEIKGDIIYTPTKVNLDINAENAQMSALMSEFLDFPIAGRFNVKSKVLYDFSKPTRAERTRVLSNLEVYDLNYASQLIGQLNSPILYEDANLNIGPANLSSGGGTAILRGQLKNRPNSNSTLELSSSFRRYEVLLKDEKSEPYVSGFFTGIARFSGYLSPGEGKEPLEGTITGSLDSSSVFDVELSSVKGELTYVPEGLYLKKLEGKKGQRNLFAEGFIANQGGKSYVNFSSEEIPIKGLGWDTSVESLFDKGTVKIEGAWSSEKGYNIEGNLVGLTKGRKNFGNGSFIVSGLGDDQNIKIKISDSFEVDLKNKYSSSSQQYQLSSYKARLEDQGIYLALSYLNEWTNPVDLSTKGVISANVSDSLGSFGVQDFSIIQSPGQKTKMNLVSLKSFNASWKGKAFENFKSATTTGETNLNISESSGSIKLDGVWSPELVDLFVPDFIRLRGGQIKGSTYLSLPFSIQNVKATTVLNGVSIGMSGLGRYGSNTNGSLSIDNGRIKLEDIRTSFGSGSATINGEYKFDWKNPGVFIRTNLNNASFLFLDEVPATVNGDVVLSGNTYPFLLNGRITVIEGLYTKESNEPSKVEAGEEPTLSFDLGIDITKGFVIRNSLISTSVRGPMKLSGTDLKPSMVGVLELEDGRIFARDNEFEVARGVLDFPHDSEDIFININANTEIETQSENYTVTLNATGSIEEPNIDFVSNPTLSLNDIASLLAFGVVRSDSSLDATGSLADTARAEALQTIFGKTIGSSLRKRTGFDVKVSASADIAQEQTIPKVTVVRKLSKKVTATFGRSLDFSRPENNVQVDYELLKNVNVSGVWENPNPDESSVGFDLRFKWDVK